MERRKHRGSNLDELAVVKAAAWAWHQNGSGAEGKSRREFDLSTTHHQFQTTPKPSRYKLEATMMATKELHHHHHHRHQEEEEQKASSLPGIRSLTSDGNEKSLFDTYEIERISRELHSYMESSRVEHLLKSFGKKKFAVSLLSQENGNKNDSRKGFWPVICGGSGRDVIAEAPRISFGRSSSSRRQNEKKTVTVVQTSSSHRRGAGVHALP